MGFTIVRTSPNMEYVADMLLPPKGFHQWTIKSNFIMTQKELKTFVGLDKKMISGARVAIPHHNQQQFCPPPHTK